MSMFRAEPSPPADIVVKDNDLITVGDLSLKVLHTPGHSPGGMCLYVDGIVFTGDTLFVGAVGRTDFEGGSWETLVSSIHRKLFSLPDTTVVLPGHNYGEAPKSTIGLEKVISPMLAQDRISKFLLAVVVLLLLSSCQTLQQTPKQTAVKKEPKIALVLGGGAAKGFAHVGWIRVLEQDRIPISMVVGTSVGSVIGSLDAGQSR